MDLHNTPAIRHDGWTRERRARFLDSLAEKGNVRLACRRVNLSPEAAYRLKRREPLFARAWAAALVLAHDGACEFLAERATEGIEEEVWCRGEFKGTRRKFDTRLFLAYQARLDKAAANEAAQADAARFDELVACIAGEAPPEELAHELDALPLDRETAVQMYAELAEDAASGDEACDEDMSEEACEARDRARAEAAALWDDWFAGACGSVDRLCGRDGVEPLPGLPGHPLPEPLARALEQRALEQAAESPAKAFPRTLSTPSTSALARSLAVAAAKFADPRPG